MVQIVDGREMMHAAFPLFGHQMRVSLENEL